MLLDIGHLVKTYIRPDGQVDALADVSLSLDAGEFAAIVGPSGSGKTTLLLAAGALLAPDAGEVLIDGRNPYRLDPNARAALRSAEIGFVFQQFHLVPYLTVLENVIAPSLARPADGVRRRAAEMVERFGLTDRAAHVPAELSTGERQRVALARALLNGPKLLLADEPTGNLDDANAAVVLDTLTGFAANGGAVLLVTHSPIVAETAQRTVRIEAGTLAPV